MMYLLGIAGLLLTAIILEKILPKDEYNEEYYVDYEGDIIYF